MRYYLFIIVNVFLGSILSGAAFEQLNSFIKQSASEYVTLTNLSMFISSSFPIHGGLLALAFYVTTP